MNTKHTPGPWCVHRASYKDRAYVVPDAHSGRRVGCSSDRQQDRDEYAQQICTLSEDWHGRRDTLADARLIAAAPELLEALQNAERCIRGYSPSSQRECRLDAIRAAIAKVTGEQQ